jgi:hypothetical protein
MRKYWLEINEGRQKAFWYLMEDSEEVAVFYEYRHAEVALEALKQKEEKRICNAK